MSAKGKAGLLGVLYAVLALISFVKDLDDLAFFFFGAAVFMVATSYICEAIEKGMKR